MTKRKKIIRLLDMFNQKLRNRSIEDASYYRHGISVNDYDSDGYNSFFYAINSYEYGERYNKLLFLLDKGGDPNISMYDPKVNGGELWRNVPIYELILRVSLYSENNNLDCSDIINQIKLLVSRGAIVSPQVYSELKPHAIEKLHFLFDVNKTNLLLKI